MSSRQTGQDFVNIFTPFPAGRDQFFPPLPSLCPSLSLSSPLPLQRFASHNAPERTNEVKYGSLVETNERPSKRYFHYLRINKFSVFRRPTQPRYIFFFERFLIPQNFKFLHSRATLPPSPPPPHHSRLGRAVQFGFRPARVHISSPSRAIGRRDEPKNKAEDREKIGEQKGAKSVAYENRGVGSLRYTGSTRDEGVDA